jgi:hypothetical protein
VRYEGLRASAPSWAEVTKITDYILLHHNN